MGRFVITARERRGTKPGQGTFDEEGAGRLTGASPLIRQAPHYYLARIHEHALWKQLNMMRKSLLQLIKQNVTRF